MAIIKSRRLRNTLRYVGIAVATYFGAPYLAAAATSAAPYVGLASSVLMRGGGGSMGGAPPEGGTVGQPIIINAAQPGMAGGMPMYSGFEGGGAGSQIYGGGGGGGGGMGISPGLMIGLAAGGFGLVVLLMLLRR